MNAVQKLSSSNPYSGLQTDSDEVGRSTGYYKVTPWQNFLSWLGLRTQADAWNENMGVQEREYQAGLAQKAYDEEYNLPINQVARMRAAGINPDLDGGKGIDPGSAAPMGEDPSVPMQSTGQEQVLGNFVNMSLSAFSSALGMVETIQGIQGKKLQNTLLGIQTEEGFNQFATGMSSMFLPDSPNSEGIQNFDWQAVALKNAEQWAGKHLPKSMQTKFIDFQKQYWSSAIGESESYSDFKKRITEKRDYVFNSKMMWSEINDVLIKIVEPYAEAAEKLFGQNQQTQLAQGKAALNEANYNAELYGDSAEKGLNPNTAAFAENAANLDAGNSASAKAVITGAINDVMRNLKSASKENGLKGALASIALALISGFYLYSQSGIHPHISKGNSTFRNDSYSTSKSSFNIGF